MLDSVRVPKNNCLNCGYLMDTLSPCFEHNITPKPGDVSICLRCGAVMKISDNLTPRGMTEAEINALLEDEEFMFEIGKIVRAIHMVRAAVN